MSIKNFAWFFVAIGLLTTLPFAADGRGGGGGHGGGGHGGGGGGMGGGAQHGPSHGGGGFGGGISPGGMNGHPGHQSTAGGFGGGAGGFGGPSGGGARPGAGAGGGGVGGPASGVGARPGMGAGGVGGAGARPGTGVGGAGLGGAAAGANVRPGAGIGGPAGGVGMRPGMGAGGVGAPGVGAAAVGAAARPGYGAGGIGGPASGIGVLPGAGAGRAGLPGGYGTHYVSSSALANQAFAVRGATVGYGAYSPAMFAGYANAWRPVNIATGSLYTHPGYAALAVGLGLSARPTAYDYGGNVVMQSETVYVDGEAVGTPEQYSQQASQIAAVGSAAQPAENGKWLPLGIFALVEGDATSSNDIFQIAVNQQGLIRGNYHNLANDQVEPISGGLDRATQRAVWTIGSDKIPIYEAGIGNLTTEATPILVHIGNGQSRQLTLIRIEQPTQ